MDNFQDSPYEAETSSVLSDYVEVRPLTTSVPEGAVRNRAATSAVLTSPPDKVAESYTNLMQEGMMGRDDSHQDAMTKLSEVTQSQDMKQVMSILSDPKIPLEQKKKVMLVIKPSKPEPARVLAENSLISPSPNLDHRGDNARISLVDTLNEMHDSAEYTQRAINGLVAQHPDVGVSTVVDVAATEVAPFGRNAIAANIKGTFEKLLGGQPSLGKWIKNFLLPESSNNDIRKKLELIPPALKQPITDNLIAAVQQSAHVVFPSDNYYAQYQNAVSLLQESPKSDPEVWTNNMLTILDGFWVGSELKAGAKAIGSAGKAADAANPAFSEASKARRPGSKPPGTEDVHYEDIIDGKFHLVDEPHNPFAKRIGEPKKQIPFDNKEDQVKRIEMSLPVRRENPVSPFAIIEQTNPEAARAMNKAIMEGGDEVAKAMTGVNREQALINNTYPQVGTETGSVLNKVNMDVQEAVQNTGAVRYTPEEFRSAVSQVKNDFRSANGLEINDAMTTFRVDGDHVVIDAHYNTAGGSFTTPQEARDQAKLALRGYGVRDDEITVMKRVGNEYRVADTSSNETGDYIIKVRSKQAIDDSMVDTWNPLDVKRNWADRISQLGSEEHGSVAGMMFDPGSMLHPTITGAASTATDQAVNLETILLKPIKEFRDSVGKFDKSRRIELENYIKEANEQGIKFDPIGLTARGFSPQEIDSLKKWKDIWDGHYYLENYDLVRTLNNQGYHIFDNGVDKLFGKPIVKNQNISKLYDPRTQTIERLDKASMDALYNAGGNYVQLRRPIQIGGVEVEHMIVRNTPTEFTRKIRDTDAVLNYREGYYTVTYRKGSKFIDEVTTVNGDEKHRTVAVAGNTKDAETFRASREASTGNKHVVREDARGYAKDGDGYWDVNDASGRIAQRVRGQPLVSATGVNQLGTGVFVENPMESASRAARSLAGRTLNRPMLDTAKARFVEQYGDMLPHNGRGGKDFPSHRSQIVDHNDHTSKRVADARTTYQYIRYLESGYINTADQVFKAGMNILANAFGKRGLSKAENLAQAIGDIAPSHAAKATVFQAYIAYSLPIRQWIVQGHQAGRMFAYNPEGFVRMGGLITEYLKEASGLAQASPQGKAFIKFVEDSGMVAGVDKNSLVRGIGLSMADSSSGFKRVTGEILSAPQRFGFDIGEKFNQLGHLAAVYEKETRAGVNLADKTLRDQALAKARALSYDLNKAGELAYTQGSAASLLQFLQMPHKAFLQATNRSLSFAEKAKLIGWDMIMWGAPVGAISAVVTAAGGDGNDILPDNPDLRDKFVYGMESFYLNALFSSMDSSGEKSRIDFSALNPYGLDGWAKMYHAWVDQGWLAALAASPTGQILAVDGVNGSRRNGRIPQAFITMGRWLNVFDEVDPENPTKFSAVVNDIAKISSGWTTTSNALLMLDINKKVNTAGSTLDKSVTFPEQVAAFVGLSTLSVKELYDVSTQLSKDKKTHEQDVLKRYRDIVNYVTNSLQTDNADVQHIQAVSSMLMRTFNEPGDMDIVNKQWQKDMVGKEMSLLKQMLEASGLPNAEKHRDLFRMAPIPTEQKDLLEQRINDAVSIRDNAKQKE